MSFLTVGNDYEMKELTEPQQEFVKLLTEFGLIYRTKVRKKLFFIVFLFLFSFFFFCRENLEDIILLI